ncbi:MAG: ankyrin repeat domain-containing protein [Candidatus Hydrogenedentes bacterium]|nr:ankyrin repeat domain-containing protein [Candidatus Hydrogenedentota bacterium]
MKTCPKSVLFLFAVLTASAAEIAVPGDHPSIQTAIDAAAPGDTVVIAPGTYAEALTLKDGVSLRGSSRDEVIVESPSTAGAVLTINACGSGKIEGITFRHASVREGAKSDEAPGVIDVVNSTVDIVNCSITNGEGHGVYLKAGGQPSLRDCIVDGNGGSGVFLDGPGMLARLIGNTITNNKHTGVDVFTADTGANLNRNVMKGNGVYGLWAETGAKVLTTDDDFTDNAQVNDYEARILRNAKRFDAIEQIAERLRRDETRYPSGTWQLEAFYDYLSSRSRVLGAEELKQAEQAVEEWKKAFPNSIAARNYLFDLNCGQAWKARGSGYIDTVTPHNLQVYRTYMTKARAVMDEAANVEPKDAEYYTNLCTLAIEFPRPADTSLSGLVYGVFSSVFGGKTEDEFTAAYNAGVAHEPLYYPLYMERIRGLLPRWRGTPAQIKTFANEAADRVPGDDGLTLFALIATSVRKWEGETRYEEIYSFSWDRVRAGYNAFLKQYPNSNRRRNDFAWMACAERDKETASFLFQELKDEWHDMVWSNIDEYNAFKAWAVDGAAFPDRSPLERAIVENDSEAVQSLLASGSDPNTKTRSGWSMLGLAINAGNYDLAERLITAGADINAVDPEGTPLLQFTLNDMQPDNLLFMLEHGADPNVIDKSGWQPLCIVMSWGRPQYVATLLQHGADPNFADGIVQTPLQHAIQKGYKNILPVLLNHGADPNLVGKDDSSPLSMAARNQDIALCKLLLERGADPNLGTFEKWAPIYEAADLGNLELARLLVDNGADVNMVQTDGWTTFHMAVMAGHQDMLVYLLELSPEGLNAITHTKYTLLHTAAKNGQTELARFLIQKGLDLNAREGEENKTPLSLAIDRKHSETAEVIRAAGGKE